MDLGPLDAPVNVNNSIISGNANSGDVEAQDLGVTAFSSGGYNIIGAGNATGRFGATGDRVGINPRLGTFAANGGTTQTYSLLPGSPALDRGNNAALTVDQRGLPRPVDGDGNGTAAIDIGAFEQQAAQPIDLTISQSDSPDPVNAGDPVTYTLIIANGGTATATNVPASFHLPSGMPVTYVNNTTTNSFTGTYDSGSQAVRFTGGTINASSSATLTVTVTPNGAGTLTSTGSDVVADKDDVLAESNETNNAATTITTTVNLASPGTPDLQAGSDSGPSNTDNVTSDTTPTFDISGVVNGATVELLRDGIAVASGTASGSTIALTDNVSDGTYSYSCRQTLGGTTTTSGTLSVTIDSSSPSVSAITRAGVSPTNAASVQFNVSFTEPVTGVDVTDFTLTTSGISGAAVTSVSGSGGSYTVTVNTGSGDGTIRLDVVDNDSIVDGAGNPLGGSGAGNGNYTGGETYIVDRTTPTPTATPTATATATAGLQQRQ